MARGWPGGQGWDLASTSFVDPGFPFTMAFWLKTTVLASSLTAVMIDNADGQHAGHYMGIAGEAPCVNCFTCHSTTAANWVKSSGVTTSTGWHSFIGEFDAASRQGWVDDVSDTAETTDRQPTISAIRIGMYLTGAAPWNGQLQDVAVWAGTLSASEKTKYASRMDPRRIGRSILHFYAPLNGGDGNTRDIIGGLDLTETGTITAEDGPYIRRSGSAIWTRPGITGGGGGPGGGGGTLLSPRGAPFNRELRSYPDGLIRDYPQ